LTSIIISNFFFGVNKSTSVKMLNLFQTPAFAFFCYLLSIVFSSFFSSSIVSSVLPASFLS